MSATTSKLAPSTARPTYGSSVLASARLRGRTWAGVVLVVGLLAMAALPSSAQAAAVPLGTASDFAVLAGSTVTNTGPSVISGGSVGVSPGSAVTGFGPGTVTPPSTIYRGGSVALQAQNDLTTAYDNVAGRSSSETIFADLAGRTLEPGVYTASTSLALNGDLTLDAKGDPNAVFVFQAGSTLLVGTTTASSVRLINGAQASNVFWQVGSSATIGVGSAFAGNILALTSITMQTNATLNGRALARNAAVTLDNNTITTPSAPVPGICEAGPGLPPPPWCEYATSLEAWRLSLASTVDALSPAELSGPVPLPPQTFKDPERCLGDEAALTACYGAGRAWQQELDAWLDANAVSANDAAALPVIPTWPDAPNPEAADLVQATHGLYSLTIRSRANNASRARVTVTFDRPLGAGQAASMLDVAGAEPNIEAFGTFLAPESIVSAGTNGPQDLPTLAPISTQLTDFVEQQVQSAEAMQADLMTEVAETDPPDPAVARAIIDVTAYRNALGADRPFISGFTATVNERALLQMIAATDSRVLSVTIQDPTTTDVISPPAARAREFATATSAFPAGSDQPAARAAAPAARAAGIAGTSYMPSKWRARTYPTGPANRFRHHVKQTNMQFEWKRTGSLNYYRAAASRQRGFEAQAHPYTGTPWSRDWHTEDSWNSNMPRAYRDDLFSDGTYKNFAIGSGNGRALKANTRYWANYQTNAGSFNTTDRGRARLEGQASSRPVSRKEKVYCLRPGGDKRCFFARDTSALGTYPLNRSYHRFAYP